MKLTKTQQVEIENSIWVVNSVLKKQGLSENEDLKQSAILYMCKCVLRFDPNRNVKWTTFAYRNIFLYVMRLNKKENIRNNKLINNDIFDTPEPDSRAVHEDEYKYTIDSLKVACTPKERLIIELKTNGYTCIEISKKIKCSCSKFSTYIKDIKLKALKVRDDEKREIKENKNE